MANNRVIGCNGQLPWRLPRDMQWFRRHTLGKPVIMGRKTCESLGGALPERRNIVVTRQANFTASGFEIATSIDEAIDWAAEGRAGEGYDGEIMIIGGETLYRQVLDQAQRLYLTEVEDDSEGDAFFPEFDLAEWAVLSREAHPIDEKNIFALTFLTLQRQKNQGV